jgi:hypothetical protein
VKRSKAIDMRYHWVRDRVQQGDYKVLWLEGKRNLADYFTKAHAPAHHRSMRSTYLVETSSVDSEGFTIVSKKKIRYTR